MSEQMRDRPDTLYAAVERQLLAELAEGRHPVGSRFPTEMELCERFGMSRHTVREALRRLTEMGLLERHQGAGTVVKAICKPASYVQSLDSLDELFQYAVETRLEFDQIDEVAAGDFAAVLGGPADGRWLHLSGRRVARDGGAPVCWTEIYVRGDFAGLRERIGVDVTPIHVMIEQSGTAVPAVEQELRAVLLSAAEAGRLGVEAGGPGLHIIRRYLGADGLPLEVTFSTHPADWLRYRMTLRRA